MRRSKSPDPDERIYTYRSGTLEVEVGFLEGKSQEETYRPVEKDALLKDAAVQEFLATNSLGRSWRKDHGTYEKSDRFLFAAVSSDGHSLFLRTAAHDRWSLAQKPTARSGKRLTFPGSMQLRTVENSRWLVLKSGENVLEIPWTIAGYRDAPPVTPGDNYTITVLDAEDIDIGARVACLSDREHRDWGDVVYDSKFYLLKRIEKDSRVLFDRAVCEVHHARMTSMRVPVECGMVGTDAAEELSPHNREFALGDCLVGNDKTALLYICPKCVAAASDHRRQQPF